jgi:hypothetical protein
MFKHIRAGRPALMALAGLAAAIAFTVPATSAIPAEAASAAPAAACHIVPQMDRDEHTGALFAVGFASCPVYAAQAAMHVNLWIDNKVVRNRSLRCGHGTNCYTSSGSTPPARGRLRYCAEATFYVNGADPSSQVWSCMYQG